MKNAVKKKIVMGIVAVGIVCVAAVAGIAFYAFHLQYNTLGVSRHTPVKK